MPSVSSRSELATTASVLPHVVIQPRRGWQSLELGELWQYRRLVLAFFWRDIKASQKQTVLGILWLFIAPLFSVLVYTIIFGQVVKIESDNIPYPLFVFAGNLLWNAFAPALQGATNSVVVNSHFIQKVYFPRLLIPTSAALSGVLNLGIVFLCLLAMMCLFPGGGWLPTWRVVFAVPLMVLVLATGLGLGMLLAPLYVKYRDIGYLSSFAIQIGFYLTPVVYPVSLVPEPYRPLLALNPMAGYITTFRWALYGSDPHLEMLAASLLTTALLLTAGAFFFARHQGRFADVI